MTYFQANIGNIKKNIKPNYNNNKYVLPSLERILNQILKTIIDRWLLFNVNTFKIKDTSRKYLQQNCKLLT